MYDRYHPLGSLAVITAFNFPVAVSAWNAMIATVCGDVTVWKPAPKVPLTAVAVQHIVAEVISENGLPEGIFNLIPYQGKVENAIALHNDVPQGLSSAVFTNDLRQAETFLSHWGSGCGITNVNIGTSGTEIGIAFGGEKEK